MKTWTELKQTQQLNKWSHYRSVCLQESLTSERSQLHPFFLIYSNAFLRWNNCVWRAYFHKPGSLAASFKAALLQKTTPGQLCDQYCCLHFPHLQKTANLYTEQAWKHVKLQVFFIIYYLFLLHFPVAFDQSKHFTARVCVHTFTRSHTETAETCTLGRISRSGAMRQLQGQFLALRPGSRVMRWNHPGATSLTPESFWCLQGNTSLSLWGDYFSQRFDRLPFVFVSVSFIRILLPRSLPLSLSMKALSVWAVHCDGL